ncbi:MAG: hypothetical protein AB3N28_14285 [Kordiimonas sp.]
MKKTFLIGLSTALVGLAHGATAQTEAQTYNTAKDCRSIEVNSTRLACYDSVTDGVAFTVEVRRKAEREAFGKATVEAKQKKSKRADPRDEAGQVSVQIISVTKLRTGKHIFITSDGQVWRQLSADHVAKEKTPYKAVIKQGRLGSYSLVSNRYPKRIKVRRSK